MSAFCRRLVGGAKGGPAPSRGVPGSARGPSGVLPSARLQLPVKREITGSGFFRVAARSWSSTSSPVARPWRRSAMSVRMAP